MDFQWNLTIFWNEIGEILLNSIYDTQGWTQAV